VPNDGHARHVKTCLKAKLQAKSQLKSLSFGRYLGT